MALAANATNAKPTKSECLASSDLAQDLRTQGQLLAARDQLAICANDACPAVVRKDCGKWLADVQESIPTIVLGAREEGSGDVIDVDVTLDGKPLTSHLDGKSIPIDPGPHKLTFAVPGRKTIELQVLLTEGDKNHRVQAVFPAIAKAVPAPLPRPSVEDRKSPSYVAPVVLGVVGLVGIGAFAYLGLTGAKELRDDRATCAPRCNPDDVDASRRKLVFADVSLGIGVVALAASTVLFLTTSPAPDHARVDLSVGPNVAIARWTTSF